MPYAIRYDRSAAVAYAHRWAYGRNPAYYDYENLGGDCTNFASQCLYAGTGIMDPAPTFGWYYYNANEKAPAWTGVEYFWNFLLRKKTSQGPFAREVSLWELEAGDFVQLRLDQDRFSHTPVVVRPGTDPETILVAAHSMDADYRPLSSYPYRAVRCLHILGAILPNGVTPRLFSA